MHLSPNKVLDMTILTRMAYEADDYDLCEMIDVYFNGTFKLVKVHREEPMYFHIRHKTEPLDIISIRGTTDLKEMIQDVSLFVEVFLWECLQSLVPFINMLSEKFTVQLIYYSAYCEGILNPEARARFDEPVRRYALEYMKRLEYGNCDDSNTDNDIQVLILFFLQVIMRCHVGQHFKQS